MPPVSSTRADQSATLCDDTSDDEWSKNARDEVLQYIEDGRTKRSKKAKQRKSEKEREEDEAVLRRVLGKLAMRILPA